VQPSTTHNRNSNDFKSLDAIEKTLDQSDNAIEKPSTRENTVISREQRRKNYKNINDYLQLANLESMGMETAAGPHTNASAFSSKATRSGFSWNNRRTNKSVNAYNSLYMPVTQQ